MSCAATPVILRPSPFRLETRQHTAQAGQSIADILRSFPDLPLEVWAHGIVRIVDTVTGREWEIFRDLWHRVRPRGGRYQLFVGVRMAGGGGQQGGKNPFATIAAIALVVAATAITGGLLGPAGALSISGTYFAAGSTSAALLAAGVSIVGALAINALAPPPTIGAGARPQDAKKASLGSASIQGNVLEPFAPIPFVIGTHRVSPPHLILPWSESVNDDQFVHAIVGLNGAHDFADIRVNGTPIDDLAEVEYEIRDVVTDDTDITLIDKQVFENQVSAELSSHKVQDDATSKLQNTANPAASYPQWSGARSRSAPDEVWITLTWTTLIMQDASATVAGGVPIRIRIRKVGDVSWINLPELHAQRERLEPFRGLIKLRFQAAPDSAVRLDQNPTRPPWKWAFYATDAQNSESFATHAYFAPASGNNANFVSSEDGVAVIYLDPATFPAGTYDVQVMRGYGYKAQDLTAGTYRLGGNIPYFFTHTAASSPPSIRQEQSKVPAKVSFSSLSSVWNEYPLGEKGLSLLAIKAKNTAISSLSVLVSGYANTWDGTDWDTFEPTSNPAAWFRTLALGAQSIRPAYTAGQLDDDILQDWSDFCDGVGGGAVYSCNAFIEGGSSIADVLKLVAGCGRAAPRASDKVGVVIDNDRSGEAPINTFTQRNSRDLSIRRAFPRVPDGLRIRFNDETNDYATKEIFVYRDPSGTDIEAVTYAGITSEAQAIDRGYHDLRQLVKRGALYNLDADIENLYCVKGSLVTLIHDTVRRHYDAARVATVALSGSDVTGMTLDSVLRLSLAQETPTTMGVVIQLKDGSSITAEIDETADTDTVTFVTPFPDPAGGVLDTDCLVACGPFSSLGKRMLVLGIAPQSDMVASLTLVDEAALEQWFAPEDDGGTGWFATGGADPWYSPL